MKHLAERSKALRSGSNMASRVLWPLLAAAVLGGLVILGLWNYVVFHSLVELFSIGVAMAIFLIAWNVRRRMDNDFLLFVALAYAAAGLLDLVHTLAYPGMGAIPDVTIDPPTQLWIAARYVQSLCLLIAPMWLTRRMPLRAVLVSLGLLDALVLLSIFRPWPWLPAFPDCHLGAAGLTPFKVISEYVISGILLAAIGLLWLRRSRLDKTVFGYMVAAVFVTMASEIAFTSYVSVQTPSNLIGHLLKAIAVYLTYKALIEAGLRRPFDVLFRDLAGSEERYRSLVQMSPDAIFVNRDNRIVLINPAAIQLFGATTAEQVLGKPPSAIFHPDYHPIMQERIHTLLEGRPVPLVEGRIVQVGGEIRDVEVAAAPFDDRQGRAIQVILRDITDRKQAEARLQQAADELARSNKELEQFAYIVSHDLQEPLRAVASFLQLLEVRFGQALGEKPREYIAFATDGAQRMSRLIQDLLDYSRIQRGNRKLAPVDMNAVFDQALANCAASIQEARAAVTRDDLPTVLGDRPQLGQLLQNLVGNAVKFRRPDVRPEVHVSATREDGQWAFQVRDNGIGIPADQADRVFQIFQRLHRREEYPGTGIGLAVCKKIVEQHGGRIGVESTPGEGSCFHFTLPAGGEA